MHLCQERCRWCNKISIPVFFTSINIISTQGYRSFSILHDLYLKVSRSKSRFQDKPLVYYLFRNDAFDFNRSVIVLYAIRVSTHRIAPLYREYYINDRTEFFHFCDTLLNIRLNDFLQVVHNDIDSQCSRLRNFIRKFVGSFVKKLLAVFSESSFKRTVRDALKAAGEQFSRAGGFIPRTFFRCGNATGNEERWVCRDFTGNSKNA